VVRTDYVNAGGKQALSADSGLSGAAASAKQLTPAFVAMSMAPSRLMSIVPLPTKA
tara:strand:- start:877 stop:1044 length:168 start_codon:yes stop_codon:yes gene_type:complete